MIKLKPGVGFKPSVADIVENPRKLKFIEVDAAQTPRSLDDVDAAAINTNFATPAGLKPSDAILREDPKGPYVNVLAVRSADKDKPWVKAFVESYRSPETKAFIAKTFGERDPPELVAAEGRSGRSRPAPPSPLRGGRNPAGLLTFDRLGPILTPPRAGGGR